MLFDCVFEDVDWQRDERKVYAIHLNQSPSSSPSILSPLPHPSPLEAHEYLVSHFQALWTGQMVRYVSRHFWYNSKGGGAVPGVRGFVLPI